MLLRTALSSGVRRVTPSASARVEVTLLGGFSMRVDDEVVDGLPSGSQRLLVFLALRDRPVSRTAVAGIMWPDVTAQRAADSLRSSLARLDRATRTGITLPSAELGLGENVRIDYADARALAHRLLDSVSPIDDGDLAAAAITTLSRDLLPDWADDWILAESNEWRHLRVSALEALAQRLLKAGRHAEAEGAARATIRIDPLRETPHATLIRIHLAEGNQSDALGAFAAYRARLRAELDIEPTLRISDLVHDIQQ